MTPESLGMQPAWVQAIIYTILVIGPLYLLPMFIRWLWYLGSDDDE